MKILGADELPVLITGVAGVSGYDAFHHLRGKYPGQVYGLRPHINWKLESEGILVCDLEDQEGLREIFREREFKSVLHCGGSCALKSCELDPQMANRVNVYAVDSLLSAMESTRLGGRRTRLVFLSIDLVFSGTKGGGYTELDIPDPVTVYGRTMAQAEQMVLKRRPDASVLRISLPMGVSFNGHAGAIDWIGYRFKRGLPATLYFDEVRTPTYVKDLSNVCETFLGNSISGVFHAGGPRRVSLYEIAQVINVVGNFDSSLLHGCYRIEAGPIPPRAGNVAMNSEKLNIELGYSPFKKWPADDSLFPFGPKWHEADFRPQVEESGWSAVEKLLYMDGDQKSVVLNAPQKT